MDSQGKLPCTPRRAQKCLFAPSNDKSDKKSVSHGSKLIEDNKSLGDDSDLGPMSPLALTDRSSSISDLSSPGREFISPFTTPEKPISTSMSWDRLRFTPEDRMSPFRSLRKVTRAARYSPRCKLFNGSSSPRSLPSTQSKLTDPLTPQRSKVMKADQDNEIVPETPQRSFATEIQNQDITETPRKSRTPERRQITPLSSISKTVPLPKLHRRKSFSTIETNEGLSPEQKENTLKRHARDQLAAKPTKLFKADNGFVSRARASLFQEKRNESNSLNGFSLSPKTFYSGTAKSERPFGSFTNSDIKRRRSLPSQSNGRRSLTVKKRKFGKINAGVGHGIKKPKPKANTEALKKEEQHISKNSLVEAQPMETNVEKSPSSAVDEKEGQRISTQNSTSKSSPVKETQSMGTNVIAERAASPAVDENKRFFKTNKMDRLNHVTVNVTINKLKLKIADGKIALQENQKRAPFTNTQKPKAVDVSLDVTDLTVDEPEVEATLQQDKVADLLKILEDDWADDEYDTMGPLTHIASVFSPLKSAMTLPKDAIMSPATELSNMTSTMNIKDVTPLNSFGNLSLDSTNNNDKETGEKENAEKKKYFPLFKKGYCVPDNIFEYVPIF